MSLRYLTKLVVPALLLAGCFAIPLAVIAQSDGGHDSGAGHAHSEDGATPPEGAGEQYVGNATHIAAGERLYDEYNCVGCHFRGGGGIGPPFLDSDWHHGGQIEQIFSSIHNGLPGGMPAWRDKLEEEQIWQLAAFVKAYESDAPMPDSPVAAVERSAAGLDAQPRTSRRATDETR